MPSPSVSTAAGFVPSDVSRVSETPSPSVSVGVHVPTSPVVDEAAGTAQGDQSAVPSRGGRLRKLVVTEYEPVKSEEVYVEGQWQPGERSTR